MTIETLEYCLEHGMMGGHDCWFRDKHGKCARDKCPNKDCDTGCVVTPIKEAIAELKKHRPMTPIFDDDVSTYRCGQCGEHLKNHWKHCPVCGRMVKWDD